MLDTDTLQSDFVASVTGAAASITVAAPLDVVKTRIQNANFGSQVGGATIIREMIRQEGFRAFFKGLTPKVRCFLRPYQTSMSSKQAAVLSFGARCTETKSFSMLISLL